MRLRWLAALLILTAGLTGCIGNLGDDVESSSVPSKTGVQKIRPLEEPIFRNPQTGSHPAFDYPTFTTIPDRPNLPEYWRPIEPANVSLGEINLNHVGEDPNGSSGYGAGIALFGQLAIIPGRSTGNTSVYDISDPSDPQLVSKFAAPGRDVDTIAFPDGRLFAVFATDQGTVPVWNLTDPSHPTKAATIEPERGAHNVGIVPGTPILYNSASLGGGREGRIPGQGTQGTAIYDLSNPSKPELVQDFENGYSCHDISFSIREGKEEYRAYCAGKQVTQIWNISDPKQPEVIVNIPVHHGNPQAPSGAYGSFRFAHLALASNSGDVLIVGDEPGGGGLPACDAHVDQGPRTVSGPAGNLYFYDISDEQNPQLMGWISANAPALDDPDKATSACTAHFGRIIPSEERNLLAIGFYSRGVNVVDFTNPSNPKIVDQFSDGTDTWDVWYYNGYLFTGDILRGMDVFRLNE